MLRNSIRNVSEMNSLTFISTYVVYDVRRLQTLERVYYESTLDAGYMTERDNFWTSDSTNPDCM